MIFLGDIHGNFHYMKHYIEVRKIVNTTIIQVGDFGIGFSKQEKDEVRLVELNEWLRGRGIVMYVWRGNHDNPFYFEGNHIYTNLKLQEDYTVIHVEGKNIFGVGGAISIDRYQRKQQNMLELRYNTLSEKRHYWYDEKFKLDLDKIKDVTGIDILVTHNTMDFCYPINDGINWPHIVKQFMGDDPGLGDELMGERDDITKFFNELKLKNNIKHHFYGHYHIHNYEHINGCEHICLDVNEFWEHKDFTNYEEELNKKYGE